MYDTLTCVLQQEPVTHVVGLSSGSGECLWVKNFQHERLFFRHAFQEHKGGSLPAKSLFKAIVARVGGYAYISRGYPF